MDLDQITEWYLRPRQAQLDDGALQRLYAMLHPRTAFLKMLPRRSRVLDLGAGDGSLSALLRWPEPDRSDLECHAYGLEKGELFDAFATWELGDWNVARPDFAGMHFDAVLCSHFIEHIAEPHTLAAWLGERVSANGRVYIEWPSDNALRQPRQPDAKAAGVNLMITHFHDDATHRGLPSKAAVVQGLEAAGFEIESSGVIRMPWLEDQFMAAFRDAEDPFGRQAAFWLASGWSQYLVAVKPD